MVSSNFRQNLHDIVLNQCQPHQFENMGNNNEPHVLENKEGGGGGGGGKGRGMWEEFF